MIRLAWAWSICLLCALFAPPGCTQPGRDTTERGSPQATLPEFAAVPPLRDASFTDSDRTRLGKDYDAALPSSRVAAAGNALAFSPQDSGADSALSDFAFALYRFVLPGYGDNGVVRCNWTGAAPEGRAWLALANRATSRWDWLPMGADGRIDFSSLLPYLEQDNLLLAIIVSGEQSAELASIVIGDNAVPFAFVTIDPDNGTVPLTVNFSGEQSTDSDGSIVKYEWDFDDDGVYDLDSGGDPTVTHTYTAVGSYTPRMRVTDDKAAQSRDGENVSVNEVWMIPPVADLVAAPGLTGQAPFEVTLDAGGSTDDVGVVNYDWDLDGDGTFELLDTANAIVTEEYEAGIWNPVVRVEDADGATDTATVQLDSDAQPTASMSATPPCGFFIHVSAGGYEPGGGPVTRKIDFEGDGTFDYIGPSGAHYPDYGWGRYNPYVQIVDDDGDTAEASQTVFSTENDIYELNHGGNTAVRAAASAVAINGLRSCLFEHSGNVHYWRYDNGNLSYQISARDPLDTSRLRLGRKPGLSGGGYPFAVFYGEDGDLVCVSSSTGNPDDESDWDEHNVDSANSNYAGDFNCDVAATGILSNATLYVSYYDVTDGELYFAFSENASPDEESDWTRHVVDTNGDAGKYHSLAVINAVPVICYFRQLATGTRSIIYARASSTQPDAANDWSAHAVVNGLPTVAKGISLAVIAGKPAVSYLTGTGPYDLKYAYSSSLTPSASSNWIVTNVVDAESGECSGLFESSGLPVVAYVRTSVPKAVRVAIPDDLTPTGPDDWCVVQITENSTGSMQSDFISVGLLGDKPLIGYNSRYYRVRMLSGE